MKFTYYIGVDVSKNKLDVAVFKSKDLVYHKVIGNNTAEINEKKNRWISRSQGVYLTDESDS